MPIPRIYRDEACPLEGYEDLSVSVLQNASEADMKLWRQGNLGLPGCGACAETRIAAIEASPDADVSGHYCPACAAARATFAEAIGRFFQGGAGTGLDFSSPEAGMATLDSDELPTELLCWLHLLPVAIRGRRLEALEKNYLSSSTNQG